MVCFSDKSFEANLCPSPPSVSGPHLRQGHEKPASGRQPKQYRLKAQGSMRKAKENIRSALSLHM
jgi:hypothetical protein